MRIHLATALLLFLLSITGHAAQLTWAANLTGAQETPPVPTPAVGTASGTFDTTTHILTWSVTAADLNSPATVAHFHGAAPPGMPAVVLLPITDLGTLAGRNAGSFSGSANLAADPALAPAFFTEPLATREAELLADLWYLNIHTARFSAGEIRGQVIFAAAALPEPAPLALAGAALWGWWASRRRTRIPVCFPSPTPVLRRGA